MWSGRKLHDQWDKFQKSLQRLSWYCVFDDISYILGLWHQLIMWIFA
jgi:hypothetical protein